MRKLRSKTTDWVLQEASGWEHRVWTSCLPSLREKKSIPTYIDQEQRGLCEHVWQSKMESLPAMKVMSSAMSRQVMGCMWTPQTTSLNTQIRAPSRHGYKWDLCPLQAIRTQSSNHLTLELGCITGQTRSPAGLLLQQIRAATAAIWLETDTCLYLQMPPVTGTLCWALALLTSTCVLLYWLTGEVSSNKLGIVERHKCVSDLFHGCSLPHNITFIRLGWQTSLKIDSQLYQQADDPRSGCVTSQV